MIKNLQKLSALVLACCAFLGSGNAWGQTNPAPQPLPLNVNFDEMGSAGTTLPAGIVAWLQGYNDSRAAAEASAPTADAPILARSTTQSGGASVYNFHTAGNSRLYIQLSANAANGSDQIAAAISTVGKTQIGISYDVELINDQNRSVGVILQYRLGTTGAWATIEGSEYSSVGKAAANATRISVLLPAAAENQENVQLRWATFENVVAGVGGSRDGIAIDNILIQQDETAPTITALTPANGAANVRTTTTGLTITFSENVVKGTGNIVLVNLDDASMNRTIAVTSDEVIVNGATVTVPVTLAANTDYAINIPATAFTDRAGNAFAGITNNTTWAFSTVEFATPVLSSNQTIISVPYTVVGTVNQASTYRLSGMDVREPVTVTASENYQVSLNGITFTTTVTVPAAEVTAVGRTIYVRLNATDVNDYAGTITHSTPAADNLVLNVWGGIYNPYAQNFNNCTPAGSTTLTGGWKQFSLTGDQTWACTTFGRPAPGTTTTTGAVEMNGYSAAAGRGVANTDWLISPAINLTSQNIPLLSFYAKSTFQGPALKVMVSTDYDGVSEPSTAAWTELNVNLPEVGSDTWTKVEALLNEYEEASVYIAFMYTSLDQADGASRWTIDDFVITDETSKLVLSNTSFDFGTVPANQFSEARAYTIQALGFTENMVITAPANFQVSKDNVTYSQSITYTPEELATEKTTYVRFFPLSTALSFEGNLTFTSGEDFTQTGGMLTGSSIPKSSTLDVVNWNVEWFGADRDGEGAILGPSDDALQFANVRQAILAMDADIYALQEIANDEAMERLVAELPGYAFVKSDTWSYSVREANFVSVPQKLYVVYRTATVQVKGQKVLLKKLYADVLANTTVLADYPGSGAAAANDDSFWASGRLPYMVMLDATVNGTTQRLHLLNIHARANSGTNMTVYNQRNFDLRVLKDSLDAQYPNVNLIMLGDYNDDVDMSVVGNNPSTYKPFVDDPNYEVLTYALSETGVGTFNTASFLDHITVSRSLTDEYIENSIRIENGLSTSIPRYFTTTSDHLPVSARFDFSLTPTVRFAQTSLTKAENEETFAVNLTLSAAQAKAHTVELMLNENATATAADFATTPAVTNNMITLTIPANATSASFDVTLVNDNVTEGDEQVAFRINRVSTDLGIAEAARTFTLTIQDATATSVAGLQKAVFSVYPNPARGEVKLSLPEHVASQQQVNLSVWSVEGKLVLNATGNQAKVQQLINDKIATMANGLYILKVEAGKEVYQAKLLKN